MQKADRYIIAGFEDAGATDVTLEVVGGRYRRASIEFNGRRLTVFKLPSSSTLDTASLRRKARDTMRRMVKRNEEAIAW